MNVCKLPTLSDASSPIEINVQNVTGYGRILGRYTTPERLPNGGWKINILLEADPVKLKAYKPDGPEDEGEEIELPTPERPVRPGA